MRRELKLMLIINSVIILFILYQAFDLLTLLYDNPGDDTITEPELASQDMYKLDNKSEIIPRILHQTYKNETIPKVWETTHSTCVNMHQDYKYILWTDEMARNFIKENYEWFLKTFDSYPYPIMRADVIRYFILYHYGGIYIDLDNGCTSRLDPLLQFPAWLRKTIPTGVSNDLMGSRPGHPFFKKVIDDLDRYNRNWFVSYITIMFSTGPLFLSVMWKQYKRSWWRDNNDDTTIDTSAFMNRVRVLIPPPNNTTAASSSTHKTYFFYTAKGSSWHLGDAKFILQMGKHWIFFFILGTILVLTILYGQYKLYQWLSRASVRRYLARYLPIKSSTVENGEVDGRTRYRLLENEPGSAV